MFWSKKPPTNRQLEALQTALEPVNDHFGWTSFGSVHFIEKPQTAVSSVAVDAEPLAADPSSEDDDDDMESAVDDFFEEDSFDKEDIDVALGEFISSIVSSGIIRKNRDGSFPKFSEVFERIFGKKHRLATEALHFEEYVEGYFDHVSSEAMAKAYRAFERIYLDVRKLVKEAERAQTTK